MQGVAYAGEGQKKEALTSFHSALKISPDYLPLWRRDPNRVSRTAAPRRFRSCSVCYAQQPGDSTSHAMLAVLEYQQGNCAAAIGHFEKAGTLLDSQLDALHAYATCLVKLKQPDQAAKVFQRALALNPDDRRERRLLARFNSWPTSPRTLLATLDRCSRARCGNSGAGRYRL